MCSEICAKVTFWLLQLSLDLSDRLERIQLTHSKQYTLQQQQQQQPENTQVALPQLAASSNLSIKLPAAAAPSFASDSLQQFVSQVNVRSNASESRSQNAFSVNSIARKEQARDEGMDSLAAFVREQPTASSGADPAKRSTQFHTGRAMQHSHDDSHHPHVPSPSAHAASAAAAQPSGSKQAQKPLAHSLYRVDSASPSFDETDATQQYPLPHFSRGEVEGSDDPVERSCLLPQHVHSAEPHHPPSTRKPDFPQAPMHCSTSGASAADAPSWLLPAVATRVNAGAHRKDEDDFVPSFDVSHANDADDFVPSFDVSHVNDADDFVPSFDISRIISPNSDRRRVGHGAPYAAASNIIAPVVLRAGDVKALAAVPRHGYQPLAQSASYIVRDSQGIELLSSALMKVRLPSCPALSEYALRTLLTPVLRKFDLVSFAGTVKVPVLMAADLVQLAPFSIHFVVDDCGDMLKNQTNWNDAQTLLQECVDFVSLVNLRGCTISFLSSSVSQVQVKNKDDVASLFEKVIANSASTRFAAVRKPNVISAFESKVFDPVFAAATPALVYVLSLHDSLAKRDLLCAEGLVAVQRAMDSRIASRFISVVEPCQCCCSSCASQ
jgi:hypothetical protein